MAPGEGCVCSAGNMNMSHGKRMGSSTLPPEPVERDRETFLQRAGGGMTSEEDGDDDSKDINERMTEQADPLPTFFTGDVTEVAEHLAAGFQFSDTSCIFHQGRSGGDDNDHHHHQVNVHIPPRLQVLARLPPPAPVALTRAIWTICLFTMVPAISTALYEPARGVVFANSKLAYYLALAAIVASGLGEAITAFWISRPGGSSRRRLSFGRAVLFASVFPLSIVLGIAGYGFIKG